MHTYCLKCGALVDEGKSSCQECGAPVGSMQQVPEPAVDNAGMFSPSNDGAYGAPVTFDPTPAEGIPPITDDAYSTAVFDYIDEDESDGEALFSVSDIAAGGAYEELGADVAIPQYDNVDEEEYYEDESLLSFSDADDNPTIVLNSELRPYLERAQPKQRLYLETPSIVGKGSATTCRISGNPAISRTHIRIANDGDDYFVSDLGSTNGTWIDGVRLVVGDERQLVEGATIVLANETFTFGLEECD